VTHAEPLIALAAVTRQRFCAQLGLILPKVAQDVRDQLNQRLEAARAVRDMQSARDILSEFERSDRSWIDGIRASLQQRLNQRESHSTRGQTVPGRLELLADEAVEDQLLAQRLAARIQDASSQDLTDLRLRLLFAEGRLELAPTDVVRPETIGRILLDEWVHAGLSRDAWQQLSGGLSNSVATKLVEAYREANRFLITNGVMPEIDLKNAVRKAPSAPGTASAASAASAANGGASGEAPAHVATQAMPHPGAGTLRQRQDDTSFAPTARVDAHAGQTAGSGGEWWSKARAQTQEVMGRIKRLFADQGAPLVSSLPAEAPHASPSPRLNALLQPGKLQGFSQVEGGGPAGGVEVTPAQMDDYIHVMRQRSSELKQAAESPNEKAIIEIVALMFQSILAEDRIQASLRVWFARLQIPVLRVALAEPDFFSTLQHPARRLIDRMGSCALGFDANMSEVSAQALEVEIRRVVQVIEQYPETGRRVF